MSFWTGSISKSVKTCDERSTFAIPIIFFFRNIHFHDFSLKNYLNRYAKQNKSGSESSVSCLKQSSEMSDFCLKQGLKPGGTPHMKGVGMLVGNFELNPLRRPIWVWPNHPSFFWPLKETMPKFTPLSETTSIPTPFLCGVLPDLKAMAAQPYPDFLWVPLHPPPPPISAKFWRATITFFSRKEKKGIYLVRSYRLHDVDRKLLTWDHALSQVRNPPE